MIRNRERKQIKPPRRCIFCGMGKASKEHFWSNWMAELFPQRTNQERIERRETWVRKNTLVGEPEMLSRQGATITKQIRAVCRSCNSGWMNVIEQATRPILTPMILGETTTLSTQTRIAIAQWSAMKFMVAEHAQRDDFVTQPTDCHAFKADRTIPPYFKIWMLRCGVGGWEHAYQRNSLITSLADERPDEFPAKNTQSMTWGIGDILFHHTATRVPTLHFGLTATVQNLAVQVWPSIAGNLTWPAGRALTGQEASGLARSIHDVMRAPNVLWKP